VAGKGDEVKQFFNTCELVITVAVLLLIVFLEVIFDEELFER
jgi:hypothetical protein